MRAHSSLTTLLHFSGLSRSGYYKWRMASKKADSGADITAHIKAIHSMRPFYGYRRMTVALRREGFAVNHYLSDSDAWFLMTDVPEGAKYFNRVPVSESSDGDFDTGNIRYRQRERYSFGFSDYLAVWGSPGA